MKSKVRLLSLVASFTLILLAIGATLVVLGIFNEVLRWDIFGPKLEQVLYGVFGACMALAVFGVAMIGVIAVQESVRDFKRFVQSFTKEGEILDAPRRVYAERMALVVVVLAALVGGCALINHAVLVSRCGVFKRLATEQFANFAERISAHVATISVPPQDNVPRDLYDLVHTIDNLEFVARTTLYIPDPQEARAMWGYTAWRAFYTNADGFARFYVAKDFEKSMRNALDGDAAGLDVLNARHEFVWYSLLTGPDHASRAVVRIDGDSRQSYREYRFGD